jgi:membrane fusion protein, heavy metal efflux system
MTRKPLTVALALAGALACRPGDGKPDGATAEAKTWSVTTWGQRFEIFPETEPLVAGRVAQSHTHVTVLADFSPLRQGTVAAVLRQPGGGGEEVFRQTQPKRDGIYALEIKPQREGTFELLFRVEVGGGSEEIPGGTVRVGSGGEPGGLTTPPVPPHGTASGEDADAVSFLKEQQWKTPFATEWVREGALNPSVTGPGRVVPAGGGEVLLTAPVDAVVTAAPWPHVGLDVAAGARIFGLVPAVGTGRSLAELESEAAGISAEQQAARARLGRLEELLELEATSLAEVEKARATLASLNARLAGTRRDLDTARASRTGRLNQPSLGVPAPWAGRVAELRVSPGQSVAAGTVLARLVKARPVWLEVALAPADAAQVGKAPAGVVLRGEARTEPYDFRADRVRLVSKAPEIDAQTARQSVRIEIQADTSELPIGSAVEAEVLLPGVRRGIVIPDSAVVDDGGTAIVYVQIEGESFSRRPVQVLERQGQRLLVDNVKAGERLVTKGAAAIRRASLLSTGAPEGHVH